MKKILIIFLFATQLLPSQTVLGKWKDYFSYFHIIDIIEKENELICATENGLFVLNKTTQEVQKISKATGLHGVKIAAVGYNKQHDYVFVSYTNGAFDIITPNGLEYFVDIPIDTDFQGDKAINHIYSQGDKAIFSMDFGVVVFDIPNLEFDETTYFRIGTNFMVANQSVVLDNVVYTTTNNGIYTHEIDDLIPNFNAWNQIFAGTAYQLADKFNGEIVVSSNGNVSHSSDGIAFTPFASIAGIIDINAGLTDLALVSYNTIACYNAQFSWSQNFTFEEALTTGICTSSNTFGGTEFVGLINHATQEKIAPDGPYNNKSYKVTLFEDELYVAPGGRNNNFNTPNYDQNGYYHFNGLKWIHISYESMNNTYGIMELAVNPINPNELFGASYGAGVVKIENYILIEKYDKNNSSIVGTDGGSALESRIVSAIFDSNGNLFISEGFTDTRNTLHIKTPNENWIQNPLTLNGYGTSHLNLDEKGWIWVGSPRTDGNLLGIDLNKTPTNTNDDVHYLIETGEGTGNLPSDQSVICTAMDNNNTLWIGTSQGLRIKKNPHTEIPNGNLDTEYIAIIQDGIPEELFKDVPIYAIAVDASNRKWVATAGGVFYLSASGEETLAFFDEDNSPIPVNRVNDIKIDPLTGIVYFATSNGLISYIGDYKEVSDEFGDILVYPNPVRPNYSGNIVIKGLANNAKVKITDINGNLLFEGIAKGGAIEWNQLNLQGNKVASGIYLALMLNSDNTLTATAKFAIVR